MSTLKRRHSEQIPDAVSNVYTHLNSVSGTFFLAVKRPAADATDALQP
jgi:hypothetical protein